MAEIRIRLAQGNLTEGDALVLVNASNTNGNLGSGVSGAIRVACGPDFQAEIHRALQEEAGGPMEPGDVLVTGAGAHPTAKWVVHVAVMDYRNGFTGATYPDAERIEACCIDLWSVLEEIDSPVPLTVAMPALGAGTGQLGVRLPTEIACDTLRAHLAGRGSTMIGEIVFYGYLLHEFIAVCDVVSSRFDVSDQTPPEVRTFLKNDP